MGLVSFTPRVTESAPSWGDYGVPDIEAYALAMQQEFDKYPTALPLKLMDLMEEARDLMHHDQEAAEQTLCRARFLLLRCCPILNGAETCTAPLK